MQRKMLFFERLMYLDGRIPVNCLMTARLRGRLSEENLRHALDKVQARHPSLRANVLEEQEHPSFIFRPDPAKIPLRIVNRRSDEDWHAETIAEWKYPFCLERDPPVRLTWIRSDEVSELLLAGHHCVCDGASLVTIFRELLKAADQPDIALTPYEPFESLGDLIPATVNPDWKTRVGILSKAALFRMFALTIKKVLPTRSGEHYLIYWTAGEDMSAALSVRCKSEGTTPYAAMCVAFLSAFQQVMGPRFKNKMMCPVNIRRFIEKLDANVMFNYAPAISLSLGRKPLGEFWAMARVLKQSMVDKIERLDAVEQLVTAEHLHSSASKLISLLLQSKGSYDFAFSNVGRLDIPDTYADFRLENFLGVTVALPWRNCTTLVTTQFRGQTDLAFVSNQNFLPRREAIAIQHKAIQTLTTALGNDVHPSLCRSIII
jgi:NRPS condensation-like uncharacterized protein